MRYGILGGLEVRDGARVIRLGAPKHRALLIRLLLDANDVVSADELVDALWPSTPPRSAPKLLQVYVSQLRRSLGEDALETRAPGYALRLASGDLDADCFERDAAEARIALADGNAPLARSLFRRALALWRGPALHDVAYEPFALPEARRLEELRLACIEGRATADLECGLHDEALPELDQLVREHPLREELRRLLMLALYRAGRQADALAQYRQIAGLLREELGLEPRDELRALEAAILNHDPALVPPAASRATSRIPVPVSSLVGRERELDQLADLVSRGDVRIVTVNGAGGSGKTRLALELARRLEPNFANGAVFVELGPLRDPSLVLTTAGRVLDWAEPAGEDTPSALGRWLQGQELLLVLDNFEHLLPAAADLPRLVSLAPRVTVVVTSRRVLHVSGEHVYPLQPLDEGDAARLFVERAVARGIESDGDLDGTIRAICRRLDGLPLAIELAAARAAALPASVLLERLAGGVAALGSGPRDAPARQQTLADTLTWSTELLDAGERRALAWLSAFRGGCSIDAAEAVAGTTLDQIEALVDSSLLQRSPGGDSRLAMLETVREHAEGLLDKAGERTAAQIAHGAYFVDVLGRLYLRWPQGERDLAVVDREIDNLRAVYDRARARRDDAGALLVATKLFPFWWVRGHFREGCDRIGALVDRDVGDAALQARALHALAALQWLMGCSTAAEASALRGVAIGTEAGDLEPVSHCHTILGILARDRGDHAAAAEHYERSGALAAELGNDDVLTANENLADLALNAGRFDEARRRWEWAVARQREQGLPDEADTMPRFGLGAVAFEEHRLDDARRDFVAAYDLAGRAAFPNMAALALAGLAAVEAARGEAETAAIRAGQAWELMDRTGGEPRGNEATLFEFARSEAAAALGDERFAELLAEGRATPYEHTFPSDTPG